MSDDLFCLRLTADEIQALCDASARAGYDNVEAWVRDRLPTGTEGRAANIVSEVLDNLEDRGGFDHWWGDIDDGIQQEIRGELAAIVKGNLDD